MFVAFELDCEEITLDIVHRGKKMEEKKGNTEFRKRWPNTHLIGNPVDKIDERQYFIRNHIKIF